MDKLPNPFAYSTLGPETGVESAVAPELTDPPVATAEDSRFVLDEEAFLADIEPLPAFLVSPSQPYLRASEMVPMLEVLAGRA